MLERVGMRLVRWICGASRSDRQPSVEFRRKVGAEVIGNVMRSGLGKWLYKTSGGRDSSIVRSRQTWQDSVAADLLPTGVNPRDSHDRVSWRKDHSCWRKDHSSLRKDRAS